MSHNANSFGFKICEAMNIDGFIQNIICDDDSSGCLFYIKMPMKIMILHMWKEHIVESKIFHFFCILRIFALFVLGIKIHFASLCFNILRLQYFIGKTWSLS